MLLTTGIFANFAFTFYLDHWFQLKPRVSACYQSVPWLQVMVVAPGAGTGLNGEVYKELGHLDWNYITSRERSQMSPKNSPKNVGFFLKMIFFIFSQGGIC